MPDNDILKRCTKAFEDIEELLDLANRQKAEIERLQKQLKEGIDLSDDVFKIVKSEAYWEFADKLHDNFISKVQKHYCRINTEHSYKWTEGYTADAVLSSIYDTLKELTEK